MKKHQLWSNFRLLVMPQLSPSMKGGVLKKLYIHPGQYVAAYDLVFDITTQTLLNIPSNDGSNNGSIEMQIEVMEDMYVAKLFQEEGSVIEVGQPIAILCDNIDELDLAKDYHVSTGIFQHHHHYHHISQRILYSSWYVLNQSDRSHPASMPIVLLPLLQSAPCP